MSKVSEPKLLVVGDGSGITGLSRIIRGILEPLSSRFQIHHLAVGYFGDPHGYPWPLYPAFVGGDDFGVKRIRNLAEVLKPDLIFVVSTFGTVCQYLEELRMSPAGAPVVAYCPVESGPIDAACIERLRGIHKLVLYTQFAKRLFVDALARSGLRDPHAEILADTRVLPHGVQQDALLPDFDRRRQPRGGEACGEAAPFR